MSSPIPTSWTDFGASATYFHWSLDKAYKILSSEDVFSFIREHYILQELLLSLSQDIRHFFPEASLVLEKLVDPDEDHEKLVVYIQTTRPVPDALKMYNRFIELWWLDETVEAGDLLATTLEFHDDEF